MPTQRVYGVYTITCTANGRVYFGESSNIHARWSLHKTYLRHQRHHVPALQADWNEHGRGAFEFRTVASGVAFRDKKVRLELEESLKNSAVASGVTVYNLGIQRGEEYRRVMSESQRERWANTEITFEMRERGAELGRMWKGRPKSEEHRANIGAAQARAWAAMDPETVRARMAAAGRGNLGKPKSAEHRRNMSAGRAGMKFSDEHRRNLSESHAGNRSASKITEDLARQIKHRVATGEKVSVVAAEFAGQGVTYTIVRNIKLGKTWRDIT